MQCHLTAFFIGFFFSKGYGVFRNWKRRLVFLKCLFLRLASYFSSTLVSASSLEHLWSVCMHFVLVTSAHHIPQWYLVSDLTRLECRRYVGMFYNWLFTFFLLRSFLNIYIWCIFCCTSICSIRMTIIYKTYNIVIRPTVGVHACTDWTSSPSPLPCSQRRGLDKRWKMGRYVHMYTHNITQQLLQTVTTSHCPQ